MFLYCFVIFLCSVLIQSTFSFEGRVSGGSFAAIENHPHHVYFGVWTFVEGQPQPGGCGGSIVSPRHVLTAAHCVPTNYYHAYVRAGSIHSETGGTVYRVTQMAVHPQYNPHDNDYDVALLALERDIYLDGKTTKIINLPPSGVSVQPGMDVVVTGWGLTSLHGPISEELMEVTIPIISKEKCQQMYANTLLTLTTRMFCAGSPQGAGGCKGDSGGAVVDKSTGIQVGVVSFGKMSCTTPRYPGVYADLTNPEIREWIQRAIGF